MTGQGAHVLQYYSLFRPLLTCIAQVFNVGQLRRQKYKHQAEVSGHKADQSANFFDSKNKEAAREREHMAAECLEQLISWLKAGGNVGIHGQSRTGFYAFDRMIAKFRSAIIRQRKKLTQCGQRN